MTLNGSGYSGGNGANAFTIDGVTGLWLQGANTNALGFGASGAMTIYNQATSGTIAYAVCAAANANGATGGGLILDSSGTVCGLSGMQYKKNIEAFNPVSEARLVALDPNADVRREIASGDPVAEIMAMAPGQYNGDGINIADTKTQLGLFAQDMCQIDERLCIRDKDGVPHNFRDRGVLALLVATVQKQQREIDALQERLAAPTIQHALAQ